MKKIAIILSFVIVNLLFSQVNQNEFLDPKDVREEIKGLNYVELNSNDDSISSFVFDPTKNIEPKKDEKVNGYRVQLLSTRKINKAEKIRDKAYDIFDHNIYIEFQTPYYKVRVGDFVDYKDCRQVEKIAKKNGFPNAWTVRSMIYKK
ncbi:MAG: SPOR domain-containing protein [Candidatus Marinimicrobia bacterium]|nr:SPOR domain-containing protein [Candidatus Neomarinimicrobiota bacterium]